MKNKKVMIIAMCLAILLMITGYSLFQTKLIINGTSEVTSSWKVYFSEILSSSGTGTATEAMTPRLTNTSLEFSVNLEKPGDSYTYVVRLTNAGSIGAIVNEINASSTGSAGVDYTITGIKKGDKLAAGADKVITIKMNYDSSLTAIPSEKVNELVVDIVCIQDDGQTVTSEDTIISKTALLTDSIKKNSPPQDDSNIDFSKISSDTNGKGLYYTNKKTEDNKTTYYFRGAVDNNYVKLGNIYFRIVRINEDGSVRLIYQGTSATSTGNNAVLTTVYNSFMGDAAFVGYMMGPPTTFVKFNTIYNSTSYHSHSTSSTIKMATAYTFEETSGIFTLTNPVDGAYTSTYNDYYTCMSKSGSTCKQMAQIKMTGTSGSNYTLTGAYIYSSSFSTSYSEAAGNITSSEAKTAIDNWYKNNLLQYANMMADAGFCNDRTLSSGKGYGHEATIYASYNRVINANPQFTCANSSRDLFTTSSSTKGNKALTYPVGMITGDEVIYAGGRYSVANDTYYLNSNQHFYTMSPYASYPASTAPNTYMVAINNSGYVGISTVHGTVGLRPVINLKSTTKITGGIGTASDPYVIKTS